MDVKSRNCEIFEFFSNFLAHPVETPWSTLTGLCQNVRRSVPYILNHIWQRWKKIEMVAAAARMRPPPIFWVFNSPSPRSSGGDGPQRGSGTSADIVPTYIKFGGVSTRCWDIAQKPPKCKNSPIDSHSNENFISNFSVHRGPLNPKRGEDTFGTRVRPHTKFGVNRPAGCREIVDKKANRQIFFCNFCSSM